MAWISITGQHPQNTEAESSDARLGIHVATLDGTRSEGYPPDWE